MQVEHVKKNNLQLIYQLFYKKISKHMAKYRVKMRLESFIRPIL